MCRMVPVFGHCPRWWQPNPCEARHLSNFLPPPSTNAIMSQRVIPFIPSELDSRQSVKELLLVMLTITETHREYCKLGALHKDICPNNLMVVDYGPGESPTGIGYSAARKGILLDLDCSMVFDREPVFGKGYNAMIKKMNKDCFGKRVDGKGSSGSSITEPVKQQLKEEGNSSQHLKS